MRKILIIASVSILFLASCKKYEDGPALSFRSKTARMTGDWTVTKFTNGSGHAMQEDEQYYTDDSTAVIPWVIIESGNYTVHQNSCSAYNEVGPSKFHISGLKASFRKDNTFTFSYSYNNYVYDPAASYSQCDTVFFTETGTEEVSGRWGFSPDKDDIYFLEFNTPLHFPLLYHCLTEGADIRELKHKQITLRFHYNYGQNFIFFTTAPRFFMYLEP